jgi:DNA sulfur modification protein DndD
VITASRAEHEFRTWAASLDAQTLSEHERKLLKLLLLNFSMLSPVGTAAGLRARKLAELIEQHRCTLSADYETDLTSDPRKPAYLKKITRLEIPTAFRGFAAPEQFVFEKVCTIAYGPNGSGKSSFFEALELALLGEIEEANAKRIPLDAYIVNDRTKQSSRPVVNGLDFDGKEMRVSPSPVDYRFCFIEKNRIEKFARISATTEHEQIARIAALFGLDDFNRFVNEFTTRFVDVSGIDIVGRNGIALRELRETVRNSQAVIDTFADKQREIVQAKADLLTSAEFDGDFAGLNAKLHGTDTAEGHTSGYLEELDTLLLAQPEAELSTAALSELDPLFDSFQLAWGEQTETRTSLREQSRKVNFRRLHQAVIDVEAFGRRECPACSTPLSDTIKDPFNLARSELERLNDIAMLEERLDREWANFAEACRAFGEALKSLNALLARFHIAGGIVWPAELSAPALVFTPAVERVAGTVIQRWPDSAATRAMLSTSIVDFNTNKRAALAQREKLRLERERWRPISGKVKELIGRENAALEEKKKAEQTVAKFEADQKALIAAAAAEASLVADNRLYASAYDSVIEKLRQYRDGLPGKLIKGVCDAALQFYNAINEHDAAFEKLAELSLPSLAGDIVGVRFIGEPTGIVHNALAILSEGHIKCLGLAILLAKNSQQDSPVLIFDDIVNAIDDDHRCAIARLLCSGELLRDHQMILTSHGEEFTKVLESCVPAPDAKSKVGRIDFLPAEHTPGIRVNYSASSRNYTVRAREHFDKNELREALADSRRALENICIELWRKLGSSKYDALLSVSLRSYSARPELAGMLQSLRKFLRTKVTPVSADNSELCACFDLFESHWTYFNKGTHDEPFLPEFDRAVVGAIVGNIDAADRLVKGKGWLC